MRGCRFRKYIKGKRMNAIDRNALIEEIGIKEDCRECTNLFGPFCKNGSAYVDACRAIFDAPTLDVRPVVRGKWERHYSRPNVYADLWWHCSVCGYKNDNQYADKYHQFCPKCGAMMDNGVD